MEIISFSLFVFLYLAEEVLRHKPAQWYVRVTPRFTIAHSDGEGSSESGKLSRAWEEWLFLPKPFLVMAENRAGIRSVQAHIALWFFCIPLLYFFDFIVFAAFLVATIGTGFLQIINQKKGRSKFPFEL